MPAAVVTLGLHEDVVSAQGAASIASLGIAALGMTLLAHDARRAAI